MLELRIVDHVDDVGRLQDSIDCRFEFNADGQTFDDVVKEPGVVIFSLVVNYFRCCVNLIVN